MLAPACVLSPSLHIAKLRTKAPPRSPDGSSILHKVLEDAKEALQNLEPKVALSEKNVLECRQRGDEDVKTRDASQKEKKESGVVVWLCHTEAKATSLMNSLLYSAGHISDVVHQCTIFHEIFVRGPVVFVPRLGIFSILPTPAWDLILTVGHS